jgi:hypothetical protein
MPRYQISALLDKFRRARSSEKWLALGWMAKVLFLAEVGTFYHTLIQTVSGIHPVNTGDSFFGGKVAKVQPRHEADHSPPPTVEV